MSEPVKRGLRYRHCIMVTGKRKTGTFNTKREAREWEADQRLMAKQQPELFAIGRHKLSDACDKYLRTVTPNKRGAELWEYRRTNALISRFPGAYLNDITSEKLGEWRDEILAGGVTGSTVNRYFNLYSHIFATAKKEWKWVTDNPFSDVKRPPDSLPREALWHWRDIRAILREGQLRGGKYLEVTQAFHIALRTAMRLQEALAAPGGLDRKGKVVVISKRKEDPRPIKVPLTRRGYAVLSTIKPFTVEPNEASVLFSKLKRERGIEGLEFRDSRATALTSMARTMDVKTLKRISRHKDINILIDVYFRESAESISDRLN